MGNIVISFLANHHAWLEGWIVGYTLGHIDDLTAYAFALVIKIPPVRAWIVANPDRAKSIIASIQQELDKDIDAAAKPPSA